MEPLTVAAAKAWSGRSTGPVTAGGVHLWVVPLDVPIGDSRPFLDAAELARLAGYRRPADGARFAASRAGLRRVTAGSPDADPASLQFPPDTPGGPAPAALSPAGGPSASPAR